MKTQIQTYSTDFIVNHIRDLENENKSLRLQIEKDNSNKVDTIKFYAVAIGVNTIALLHNVHPVTVRKYINAGLISKHPKSTDGKILVRGSEALKLDFSELKKEYCNKRN